ncbi:MAG TPA: alpha-hydroxy acid oxidase [Gammaproteobacteria bacterium]|jgi:isopentenyl diphosphate isomerase/L-lactate dehydrogenase-like FMN-dependent dehydrogenase|nr:alpha-hydroxy acid oxidase [Gammaproteobacteria bacterium]
MQTDKGGISNPRILARRELLKFIFASPFFGAMTGLPVSAFATPDRATPETARQALDIFQIKKVAREKLPLPVWHFIINGSDDGKTMAANRDVFDEWELRVRRMIDVSNIDTSVELFGDKYPSPIILAPIGAQQRVHPEGELAIANAAAKRNQLMIASMMTSYSFTEIATVGGPLWFQMYSSPHTEMMLHMLSLAEAVNTPVLVLTVDTSSRGNREGELWFRRQIAQTGMRIGNIENYKGRMMIGDPSMTWDIIKWVRDNTRMKIVLKGIVTREDAALAIDYGVDGIIVSNHGGRQEESNRATLDSLIEVLEGTQDNIPVLIDGGFRRGTDIFKALALGAKAVAIGRPQVYGLGAFGQEGVDQVLRILNTELETIMKFVGATSLSAIKRQSLIRKD